MTELSMQKNGLLHCVLFFYAFEVECRKGNDMARYTANAALTNINYTESIFRVVDDVVDDGRNLTFVVPLSRVKRFLRIMKDAGIAVTRS